MQRPNIKTELPGPKAKKWLKMDKRFISPSYTRSYPAVLERGEGVWVYDVDGNRFLDMTAGVAVLATGHVHPEIVEAALEQMKNLIHMSGTDFYYPAEIMLAEKLAEIVPGAQNRKVFFGNSGAEANEAAFKLARFHTKRPYVLSFIGSFHGRTYAAMSLSGSKSIHHKGFSPLVPGIIHIPYPDPYRTPFGVESDKVSDVVIDYIENIVFKKLVDPEEVSAIFFEPIQGEGGYIVPPDDFFKKLKNLAEKYGILLVDDEVQAGMGRTGKMFAIEHFGIIPDIVTVAKGIASGFPLGAMIAKSSIMDWSVGAHASTFGGNPVSCMAAIKTIELLEDGLIDNAAKMGDYLLNNLKKLMERYEFIGDVRGKGLMIGVDIVKDRKTKEHNTALRDRIVNDAFGMGLLLLGAGPSAIRWAPSLIVNKQEIDVALEIFEEALKKA